jgi:outer membrane usher protein
VVTRVADAENRESESGEGERFMVGYQGLVYLNGLKPENQLRVQWPGGTCMASVPYEAAKGQIPYLGQFTCAPTEQAR